MTASTARELSVTTDDAAATRDFAALLAPVARPGDLILLHGELGAGKTQFAKGFGVGLGVTATINSPSFVLMAEYAGRLALFHLDLFRLAGPSDVVEGGLLDERRAEGVTIVEWAERLGQMEAEARLDVAIDWLTDTRRSIRLRATDPSYDRYIEALG